MKLETKQEAGIAAGCAPASERGTRVPAVGGRPGGGRRWPRPHPGGLELPQPPSPLGLSGQAPAATDGFNEL